MEHKHAKPPRQEALFNDGLETDASAPVALTTSERAISAGQRTFNRLTERIRKGRERLAAWDEYMPRFQGRVAAELEPIERDMGPVQRRLAQQLAGMLADKGGARLSRRHAAKARLALLEIIDSLLGDGPDPELEALYDRYSDVSHTERRQLDVDMAEAMFGEILGSDVMEGHQARSVDELARHAAEKIAATEERLHEASTRRNAGGKSSRAIGRKAQAAHEASLSVREIYRKLASALHPDRETDASERERKTGLLQRANRAYDRNDLLELLTLQVETEQIDAGALKSVPEERLRHYNHVLLEQASALDSEVEERVALFRMTFDLTVRDVTPQRVDQALSLRVAQARTHLKALESDSMKLADPRQRRAVLDALPDPEDTLDFEDMALLAAMFNGPGPFSKPRKRKRRRR